MHATAINNLVFLGGSCNPTTWRSEVAIPYLKQVQVQFYNPQVDQWKPELIDQENMAKHNAGVLLFVIDNQTRAVSALIELAELAASNRVLVCVLKNFIQPNTRFSGELISEGEYLELRHAQAVVKRLMEQRGVPVFSELKDALMYTAELIKRQSSTDELIRRFSAAYLSGLLKPPTKLVRLREIFRSLDIGNTGEIRMYDVQYAYQLITKSTIDEQTIRTVIFYQLRCSDNYAISENNSDLRLNFEQFCCLLAIHEHQRKVGSCTTTSFPPGVQSNGKLRPLQWIFDWFSGVHSRSDCDLHLNHTTPIHDFYTKSTKSSDQLDGVSSRSRTPVQRLDSGVYCNQSNTTNSTPTSITINNNTANTIVTNHNNLNNNHNHNHNYNSNVNLSLCNLNETKLVTGGLKLDFQSNQLEEQSARHLYPFQAECRDVYLGGSGLPSRWREELAIPILRKQHLTFYYQYDTSHDDTMSAFEASAILNSRILLFVITGDQRSLASMIMAAHFITKRYNVILCVQQIEENELIGGEQISSDARKDYNRGRDYLADLCKRYNTPLFRDIISSVLHVKERIREMNKRK